jgi:hypothetical protein
MMSIVAMAAAKEMERRLSIGKYRMEILFVFFGCALNGSRIPT